MKIKQSRIRKGDKILSDLEEGNLFYIGVNIDDDIKLISENKLGIDSFDLGAIIFPEPTLGIMNKRNTIGDFTIDKNKPKEPYDVAFNWTLVDWGGNTHSGTSYITKYRYHRDFIEPKEMKLLVTEKENNEKIIIINKVFENIQSNFEDIKFATNLLLEIFGQAETFKIEEGDNIVESTDFQDLPWEVLPPGERIWEAFNQGITESLSASERTLMKERFSFLEQFKPSNRYKGEGGYIDYVIFEYDENGTYILESIIYGNATYILKDNWENVSKLTKKEIINGDLAEDRIVHNNRWQENILEYLPSVE